MWTMLGLSIVDKTEHRQLFPQIPIRPSGYYHHFVDCYGIIFNKAVLCWYGSDKHIIQKLKSEFQSFFKRHVSDRQRQYT